ncbi:hypothetical protein NFX46_21080 [Streptomyces phaeoluteigriseus]|uniref:Hemerythrin-like domain-containing protein n=1 Tax=Streptomyces phaeoluteigriseus TaxID=114686 RepID=A0ABY4ZAC3_9ACTN|nr:hypothetical protein [Streptomyces phaeoluteigriseus]USQ85994.1 hypothetical protein NFX46_21080 [Streptomyces phaeoluteigriseus]
MCEYCGCQSLASMDEPTREHDEVVRLISHLRPARRDGDVDWMAQIAREITTVLGPHTRVEEHDLRIQLRPHLIDGCLTATGLTLTPPTPP